MDSNNKNIIADLDKKQIAQIFGNYNANATLGQYGLTKDYTYDKADKTYVDSTGKKFKQSEKDPTVFVDQGDPTNKVSITDIFSGITTTIANNVKNKTNNYKVTLDAQTGHATLTGEQTSYDLEFDTSSGKFKSIGGENPSVMLNMGALSSGLINRNGNSGSSISNWATIYLSVLKL